MKTCYTPLTGRRLYRRWLGGLLAALLAGSFPPSLIAQEAAEDQDEPVVRLTAFDVVTDEDAGYRVTNALTATRIGTPIMETPLNIAVITRELLDDLGTRNSNQMFDYVAAVSTSFDAPSNAQAIGTAKAGAKLRGFTTSAFLTNNFRRTKSFHIDGIDRTEIVKGPLGVYFGRTDPGGVVNFISKKPEFRLRTDLTATVGNNSFYKGVVDHQGIVMEDQLAYRVVGSFRDSDDWMDDTAWREEYFLGTLRWRPLDTLEIDAQFEYFNQNRDGGRVSAIVANSEYLAAAAAGELQDVGLNPENLNQWRVRQFNETGRVIRTWDSFWFPRGHTFNRNGPGAFDNNLAKSVTIDGRWQALDNLAVRLAYDHIDDVSDVSWFINQDPHQSPNHFSRYFNGGDNSVTSINYGFFQSPGFGIFGEGGGTAPGRQALFNKTHAVQTDLTYSFEALHSKHTFIGSLEYITDRSRQHGYLTDRDAFVRAGGIPGGSEGLGNDPNISAESNQILMQRHAEMVAMGLLQPGQGWNAGPFAQFYANLADPAVPVPNMRDWLIGRAPLFNSAGDTIDRGASIAYRGVYLDGRLSVLGALRRQDFRQVPVANDGNNNRLRNVDWRRFTANVPTVGANYYVTPELVAYASYSETFMPRPGNVNNVFRNRDTGETLGGDVLEPEEGIGWEVGVKTSFREAMFSGTASYFELTRQSLIVAWGTMNNRILDETFAAAEAGRAPENLPWINETNGQIIDGANTRPNLQLTGGEQQTRGVEFDFIVTPNDNFQAILSYIHFFRADWTRKDPQDIHVSRGGLFEGFNVGGVMMDDGRDAIPNRMQNVPLNQFGFWGKYSFTEGALNNLSLGFGGNYRDKEIHEVRSGGSFEPFNSGDSWRFDAMASYRWNVFDRPLTVQLSVNNVFDEKILSGTFGVNPTREWSLSARYSF